MSKIKYSSTQKNFETSSEFSLDMKQAWFFELSTGFTETDSVLSLSGPSGLSVSAASKSPISKSTEAPDWFVPSYTVAQIGGT